MAAFTFHGSAQAADYSNSHLMDNGVFDNVGTMTEAQIQSFLTSKGSCLASYNDVDPTWTGTTWTYTGSVPASHTIWKVAQQWGLNPQVIISTLQKEQSLISGASCVAPQINSAMGYDCPDGGARYDYPTLNVYGTCVAHQKNVGFARQVLWGSWQLMFGRQRSEGNTAWDGDGDITYVGYMTQGTFCRVQGCTSPVTYDGNATIDGQLIHLDNGATAALYSYTPHLNQSFPGIFESWFGSVLFHGDDPIGSLDLVQQAPGAVRLAGWGFDRSMAASAAIHIYIDGTWAGAITANTSRPDVGAVYPTEGNNRGFDSTVPYTTAGTHQVCAWVVGDNIGAPNYGLGCKSININNDPIGSWDIIQQNSNGIRLAGWGNDPSLSGPATIHVYIDGTLSSALAANIYRSDVGYHGFDFVVSAPPGIHRVCSWVVGDNIGAPNYGLGCKNISL